MTNQISFNARLIKSTTIAKCVQNGELDKVDTSFVELSPNSIPDKEALRKVNWAWDCGDTFVSNILDDFMDEDLWVTSNKKYYALTTQKNNLRKPIADKIVGLVEVITGSPTNIKIKNLQTDPQHKYEAPDRQFIGIGTAILDILKIIFRKKDIILDAAESAVGFYEKNGFECAFDETDMIFRRLM